jgi:hypothetical protein
VLDVIVHLHDYWIELTQYCDRHVFNYNRTIKKYELSRIKFHMLRDYCIDNDAFVYIIRRILKIAEWVNLFAILLAFIIVANRFVPHRKEEKKSFCASGSQAVSRRCAFVFDSFFTLSGKYYFPILFLTIVSLLTITRIKKESMNDMNLCTNDRVFCR